MTPLAPHLSAFLRERLPLERGASTHTCDSYAYAFKLLLQFAARRLSAAPSQLWLEQLDAALLLHFLEHLETDRHNSPRSRNARLAAIKSFFRFVEHRVPSAIEQVRRVLAIPSKRTDQRLIPHLTVDEVQAVLDAPAPTTRDGTRDRAMLHLAYAAGLRVSELVGLRLDELSFQPHPAVRIRGKGRRERQLPLWKQTATALRAWLAARPEAPAPEVFLNARGQPMTRSGFEYILDKHVAIAAKRCPSLLLKTVSPHVLRHSCAIMLLRATHDVRKVALWLGHASVQTTEIYLRADPTEAAETLAATIPPTLRPGRFRPPDAVIAMLTRPRGP